MGSTRRIILAAVAVVVAVVAAGAMTVASATPSHAGPAERLRAIESSRLKALVAADVPAARKAMAADFQQINPAGDLLSREDLLGAVKAGVLDFLAQDPIGRIAVRASGRSATLRYRTHFDLVVGGTHLTHDGWTTVLYERRHGHWRAVWAQTTAIPNDPDLFLQSLMPKS
jgi:hypothetical protein